MCTVFTTLVQRFRLARAGNVQFARVCTRTGTPCTVQRLVSPGNVTICPCLYSYWYPLYSATLGQRGKCTYLPVFVLVLCVNRCTVCTVLVLLVQRFLGLARAMYLVCPCLRSYCTCTPCTVFRLAHTGNVPICPCLYSLLDLYHCTVFYKLSRCACSATYFDMDSVSLGPHRQCAYFPVLVSLYSILVWVTRAMYVSSCLDSHAVLVALLLLTWTVCW